VVLDASGNIVQVGDKSNVVDDALGGSAYYLGRIELEIPLGSSGKELGLRPSIFVDAGALWGLNQPNLIVPRKFCVPTKAGVGISTPGEDNSCPTDTRLAIDSPYLEVYRGDTPSPRLSVGFGVNWNSPFGPFRIDIAKALMKADGDDTKLITFNVGTAF
jgi:outer membrane protein insertion porin family